MGKDPEVPIDFLGVLTNSFFVLDRAGYLSVDSGVIGEMCDHLFQAVHFYERANEITDTTRCHLLDVHVRMHRHDAAIGIVRSTRVVDDRAAVVERLELWKEARKPYDCSDDESLVRYVGCCARIRDWHAIVRLADRFPRLSAQAKGMCSLSFARAVVLLKGDVHPFLPFARKDHPLTCLFISGVEFREGHYIASRQWIERGIRINSSTTLAFLPMNYEPTIPIVHAATIF
jgi:hypothetical protein